MTIVPYVDFTQLPGFSPDRGYFSWRSKHDSPPPIAAPLALTAYDVPGDPLPVTPRLVERVAPDPRAPCVRGERGPVGSGGVFWGPSPQTPGRGASPPGPPNGC